MVVSSRQKAERSVKSYRRASARLRVLFDAMDRGLETVATRLDTGTPITDMPSCNRSGRWSRG